MQPTGAPSPPQLPSRQQQAVVLRAIWAAMLASVALYAALPLFVASPAADPSPAFVPAMLAAAAVTAFLSFHPFQRPRLLAQQAQQAGQPAGHLALGAKLVPLAMCEAIAIEGLVLYLVTGEPLWTWVLAGAAAVLLFVHAPRTPGPADARDLARPDIKLG